jgi:hypothetical protein
MIHLVIHNVPSLHERNAELRQAMVDEIKAQLRAPLERKIWHLAIIMRGRWFLPDGRPTSNNTDGWLKPMFDCLSEAGGLGPYGRGDQWLDRSFSVSVEQADTSSIEITLS